MSTETNEVIPANGNMILDSEDKKNRQRKVKEKFKEIFQIMGYDIEHDHNLKDTPNRIAKMYFNEIFKGNFDEPPHITVFPNVKNYDQIVLLKDIEVKSMCSHHFQNFIGKAHLAYLPGNNVVGLSKLSRIVDYYSRRPQIQEELTEQIVAHVENLLQPKGVALVMECQHFCMKVRGVEEHESHMVTSAMRGVFKENIDARQEFLSLIKKG